MAYEYQPPEYLGENEEAFIAQAKAGLHFDSHFDLPEEEDTYFAEMGHVPAATDEHVVAPAHIDVVETRGTRVSGRCRYDTVDGWRSIGWAEERPTKWRDQYLEDLDFLMGKYVPGEGFDISDLASEKRAKLLMRLQYVAVIRGHAHGLGGDELERVTEDEAAQALRQPMGKNFRLGNAWLGKININGDFLTPDWIAQFESPNMYGRGSVVEGLVSFIRQLREEAQEAKRQAAGPQSIEDSLPRYTLPHLRQLPPDFSDSTGSTPKVRQSNAARPVASRQEPVPRAALSRVDRNETSSEGRHRRIGQRVVGWAKDILDNKLLGGMTAGVQYRG